jgi:glycosyltransferase involved in cell wall biosynthesis
LGFILRILLTCYIRFASALAWHARKVARALARDGHEVQLFCQQDSPLAEWTRRDDYAVDHSLNLNSSSPAMILRGMHHMRRALREFRPDVLNPHCPPGHSYLALARKLERMSLPLVRTVAEPRSPKRNPVNLYLHERLTQGLVYTTASSKRRYHELFDLRSLSEAVILPGFLADEFTLCVQPTNLKRQLNLPVEKLLFGIVARMSPEKGQEVLIEALALLPESVRNQTHFLLTGEDSRERGQSQLRALAETMGVQNLITFQPRHEDIRPVIAALDVGLITSVRSEALCRVALEYMSFNKPVISSNVNILPEVVRDNENGWVFPNRDAAALARAIEDALLHPEKRERFGARGHALVTSEFAMHTELSQLLSFYREAMSRNSP